MKRCKKKECVQCIDVFNENVKCDDDFTIMKSESDSSFKRPCESTVNLIKATNKILSILEDQAIGTDSNMYDSILKTIMSYLRMEELYTQSNFNMHPENKSRLLGHKEDFICKIVQSYMKKKSQQIGSRISEQEKGQYIRHRNKKRVHEAGQ